MLHLLELFFPPPQLSDVEKKIMAQTAARVHFALRQQLAVRRNDGHGAAAEFAVVGVGRGDGCGRGGGLGRGRHGWGERAEVEGLEWEEGRCEGVGCCWGHFGAVARKEGEVHLRPWGKLTELDSRSAFEGEMIIWTRGGFTRVGV